MDTRERKGNGAPRRKLMSTLDSRGRTIWIADAHRGDGKRFVVRADEKLTAFLELSHALGSRVPFIHRKSLRNLDE